MRSGGWPRVRGLPFVDAHGEVTHLRHLLENAVLLSLEKVIEPRVGQLVIVQPRVAHAALSDDGILGGALVAAVERGRDHRVLLIRDLRTGRLPHVIVGSEVGPNGDVVPGHEPKTRHVDLHIVMEETSLVPRGIVRRPANHRTPGINRHLVGEDSVWSIHSLNDFILGKMAQRLRPIYRRLLL